MVVGAASSFRTPVVEVRTVVGWKAQMSTRARVANKVRRLQAERESRVPCFEEQWTVKWEAVAAVESEWEGKSGAEYQCWGTSELVRTVASGMDRSASVATRMGRMLGALPMSRPGYLPEPMVS